MIPSSSRAGTAYAAVQSHLFGGEHSLVSNLGTGYGHFVREVMASTERVTGWPVPHRLAPRRERPIRVDRRSAPSTALLQLELGHSLEEICAAHGNGVGGGVFARGRSEQSSRATAPW